MPDLDWRSRGQRFFPVRRKTYIFLHITSAPFLRLFANQPRRKGTHDVDDDDEPAQGGPVLKNYSFTINERAPVWCPHGDVPAWFSQVCGTRESGSIVGSRGDDSAKDEWIREKEELWEIKCYRLLLYLIGKRRKKIEERRIQNVCFIYTLSDFKILVI